MKTEMKSFYWNKQKEQEDTEKKNKPILLKIINICLKKGYHFSYNRNTFGVDVSVDDFDTSHSAYYKGELVNFRLSGIITLSELLNKIK